MTEQEEVGQSGLTTTVTTETTNDDERRTTETSGMSESWEGDMTVDDGA